MARCRQRKRPGAPLACRAAASAPPASRSSARQRPHWASWHPPLALLVLAAAVLVAGVESRRLLATTSASDPWDVFAASSTLSPRAIGRAAAPAVAAATADIVPSAVAEAAASAAAVPGPPGAPAAGRVPAPAPAAPAAPAVAAMDGGSEEQPGGTPAAGAAPSGTSSDPNAAAPPAPVPPTYPRTATADPAAPPAYPAAAAPASAPAPAYPAGGPTNQTDQTDLILPLTNGASGLARLLPPGAEPAVSAYALKIDDMAGLVTPKGYELQQHQVVTADGYKLGVFRIPQGRKGPQPPPNGRRPVVLLIHGISLASTCWVINSPEQSLAFILADQGYDVWMMNTRGNTFSRQHVRYNDEQWQFWNFSVDDFAHSDLRETMKYVQEVSGQPKMALVGHSQGGTIALMALADDPWLADSVSVLVALGPCAYVRNMQSVVLSNFCKQANTSALFRLLPPQELSYMSESTQSTMLNGACQMPGSMLTCLTTMEGIFGSSKRITAAQYRRYWQTWPSSTSLGNAMQWAQIYNEPKPRFFRHNYGAEYDLGQIRAPIVMVSGTADVLAAPADIDEQRKRLRRVIKGEHVIPDYSHMDFIWDTNARRTVYPIVVNALADALRNNS